MCISNQLSKSTFESFETRSLLEAVKKDIFKDTWKQEDYIKIHHIICLSNYDLDFQLENIS